MPNSLRRAGKGGEEEEEEEEDEEEEGSMRRKKKERRKRDAEKGRGRPPARGQEDGAFGGTPRPTAREAGLAPRGPLQAGLRLQRAHPSASFPALLATKADP